MANSTRYPRVIRVGQAPPEHGNMHSNKPGSTNKNKKLQGPWRWPRCVRGSASGNGRTAMGGCDQRQRNHSTFTTSLGSGLRHWNLGVLCLTVSQQCLRLSLTIMSGQPVPHREIRCRAVCFRSFLVSQPHSRQFSVDEFLVGFFADADSILYAER